jgi:hypothetical protein
MKKVNIFLLSQTQTESSISGNAIVEITEFEQQIDEIVWNNVRCVIWEFVHHNIVLREFYPDEKS